MSIIKDIKMDNVWFVAQRKFAKTIEIKIIQTTGEAYMLESGDQVVFAAKRRLSDTNAAIKVVVTNENQNENGIISIELTGTNTDVEAGRYFFNIVLKAGIAKVPLAPSGYLLIENNAILPSDFN